MPRCARAALLLGDLPRHECVPVLFVELLDPGEQLDHASLRTQVFTDASTVMNPPRRKTPCRKYREPNIPSKDQEEENQKKSRVLRDWYKMGKVRGTSEAHG
eukprot:6173380-Pleurochrysis_carterae.AAC.1